MLRVAGFKADVDVPEASEILSGMAHSLGLRRSETTVLEAPGFGVLLGARGKPSDTALGNILATESSYSVWTDSMRAVQGHSASDPSDSPSSAGLGLMEPDTVEGGGVVVHYSKRSRGLRISRDRFGSRTCYLWQQPGILFFASEIKALLTAGAATKPNLETIARFLGLNYRMVFGRNSTFFEGIHELGVGSVIEVLNGRVSESFYWEPPSTGVGVGVGEGQGLDDLAKQYRSLLTKSVERSLNASQRPVFLLSGGLDAPSVAQTAFEVNGGPIFTAAIEFPEHRHLNEGPLIEELSAQLSRRHMSLKPDVETFLTYLNIAVKAHDQPLISPNYVLSLALFDMLRGAGFQEIFGGGGGDVVSQGCLEYQPYILADYRDWDESRYKIELEAWELHVGPLMRFLPQSAESMRELVSRVAPAEIPGLINNIPEWVSFDDSLFGDSLKASEFRAPWINQRGRNRRHARIVEELRHQAIATHFVEELNLSLVPGMKAIDPFWDLELVNFGLSLPLETVTANGWTKRIVRKAMKGSLPSRFLERRDKVGLGAPFSAWLHDEKLRAVFESAVFSQSFERLSLVDSANVRNLLNEHLAGQQDHGGRLWKVFSLAVWAQEWLS